MSPCPAVLASHLLIISQESSTRTIPATDPILTSVRLGWRRPFCRFRTFLFLKVVEPKCQDLQYSPDNNLQSSISSSLRSNLQTFNLALPSPCFSFEFHSTPGSRRHRAPFERIVCFRTLTRFINFAERVSRTARSPPIEPLPRLLMSTLMTNIFLHKLSPSSLRYFVFSSFDQMASIHDERLPKRFPALPGSDREILVVIARAAYVGRAPVFCKPRIQSWVDSAMFE